MEKTSDSVERLGDQAAEDQSFLEPGELLLGFGTVILAVAIAFTHFVMGIFLAVPLAILAVSLLGWGIALAKGSEGSAGKRIAGLLLLFAALGAAAVVGFKACSLSYAVAYHSVRPSAIALPEIGALLQNFVLWFILAGFALAGLRQWTDWSRSRRVRWCIVAFAFPLTVIVAHQILAALGGPLNA